MARAVIALAGVTACGKSDLAMGLAQSFNGEIISVDAAAIYQELNIGTAKPTAAMRSAIPHHLIDIIAPDQQYNVQQFIRDTVTAIGEIEGRGRRPILVGGTMMYFNILLNGLSFIPAVSPTTKAKLEAMGQSAAGLANLHHRLSNVDSESAKRFAPTDKQRIIRALSVYEESGKPLSHWLKTKQPPPLQLKLLRLIPPNRSLLRQRIRDRLDKMWENGLLEETESVRTKWQLPDTAPALRLIGYRQAMEHLNGKTDITTMKNNAYFATSQFARQQCTWLNRWQHLAAMDPFSDNCLPQLIDYFK